MSERQKIKSSPKLLQFYVDWLAWAEAGGPKHPRFNTCIGLCSSVAGRSAYFE